MSTTKVESDSSTTTDSEGDESTSSSSDNDATKKNIVSEPELIGVLPPKENDDDENDDDDDDYLPSGRTVSGNFPKKVPKAIKGEINKSEEQNIEEKGSTDIIKELKDNVPTIIIDIKDIEKQDREEDDTRNMENDDTKEENGRKESDVDDFNEEDVEEDKFDDDGTRYARSISFCGKKLEDSVPMAAEKKPEVARTEKRTSQWEELMRKFSEAHKEECKTVSLDIPRAQRSIKQFPTGSTYEGTWDLLGMSGFGTYTFPNGVIYVGDFDDGMFHGEGELRYPEGAIMRGTWKKGHMIEKTLLFADGLEYSEVDWAYCRMPDRRFTVEYENGLQPSGKSYLTADQPTREIPDGYYDTGDGFYDPKTKIVYSADDITNIVRSAGPLEAKWIVDNCRTSPEEAVGPRQELYEKWSEPQTNPEPPPPPAVPTRSNRRETTFSDETNFDDVFYETLRKSRTSCVASRSIAFSDHPITRFHYVPLMSSSGPSSPHIGSGVSCKHSKASVSSIKFSKMA